MTAFVQMIDFKNVKKKKKKKKREIFTECMQRQTDLHINMEGCSANIFSI